MSFSSKWFCLAFSLTVLAWSHLETVFSLKCYDCNEADGNCDNSTGTPTPLKTCVGDVCYSLYDAINDELIYQSCGDFSYFTIHLKEKTQVQIGYCNSAFGSELHDVDVKIGDSQGRPDFGSRSAMILCSCAMNDLCNNGTGPDNTAYGQRIPTNGGGGTPHSLSNFVLGICITGIALLAVWILKVKH